MLNIDFKTIQREAAGSFASDAPPVVFKSDAEHPIIHYIHADTQGRRDLISDHPLIESILCISDEELYEMYIPMFVPVFTGDTPSVKLAGAFGPDVESAIPASIAAEKALGDFAVFLTKKDSSKFISGSTLPDDFFNNAHEKLKSIESPVAVARIPIIIPKQKGFTIVSGDIRDHKVQQSLRNYSPLALRWLKMFLYPTDFFVNDFDALSDEQLIDEVDFSVYGNNIISIKPEGHKPTNKTVRTKIIREINTIRLENEEKYFTLYPEHDYKKRNYHPHSDQHVTNTVELNSMASSKTEPTSAKFKRNIFNHLLFFASTKQTADNTPRAKTLHPTLSSEFLDTYGLPKSEMAQYLRNCIATFVESRAKSNDYLHQSLHFPHINNTTANLFLINEYHTKPLDEEVSMIGQRISALTFLPPPKAGSNLREYEAYVSNTKQNEMDAVACEVAENRKIIDKKSFIRGRQDSIQDAMTTIANIDALFAFICDFDDDSNAPDIAKMLRELANIISTRDFQNFTEKHERTLPWIPHTVICIIHSIIASFAKIAGDCSLQRRVKNNEEVPTEIYQPCWDLFNETMRDFRLSVNNSNPRAFGTAPASYAPLPVYATPTKRGSDNDGENGYPDPKKPRTPIDATKRGWLKAESTKFAFPQGLSVVPCKMFAMIGHNCSYGRNCSFSHKAFPGNWKMADRSILVKWIETNSKVSFADSVDVTDVKKGIKKHEENVQRQNEQGNQNDSTGNQNNDDNIGP